MLVGVGPQLPLQMRHPPCRDGQAQAGGGVFRYIRFRERPELISIRWRNANSFRDIEFKGNLAIS
jgi:hypothetical protein